jgi:UDP-glucose 4-epimerase
MVIRETGSSSRLEYLPPLPEGDMTRRKPDVSKMDRLLNRQLTPVEEGIRKIIAIRKK